jgi:FixJ family two-component response regulator
MNAAEDIPLPKVPMISIVDDDASVREATKGLVRSLGYAAATFGSAEEFLKSDHIDDTSCLITDVQMPGLSGVELQSRLAASGRRLPVIFITAFPEERTRVRALEAGAYGFLSKPFRDECLIGCLNKALDSRNADRAER